ncbi:MAG: ATP-binding cassette domain-containing protein [Desulfosarcinaceae bacterium]|nr:ATP-binding cassette domain-containing protein [Desulfosarcinaceae bacterium]
MDTSRLRAIARLSGYTLWLPAEAKGLTDVDLTINEGEFWQIDTTSPAEARLLLRAMATLERPTSGDYHYKEQRLDFSDYRHLLPIKRRIAYISSDATLVSNRTLRENLLLGRFYHENSLEIRLDDRIRILIDSFALADKLEIRAAQLSQLDRRIAICIREIAKEPELLLLYRPEEMIDHQRFEPFVDHLEAASRDTIAGLVFSYDQAFIERFTNRRLTLQEGILRVTEG